MANKIPRVPVREQDPKVRATNFEEVCYGYNAEEAQLEATRCLHCKNPRCVAACPVSVKIPHFIAQVAAGNFAAAAAVIAEDSSLPAICGRVCVKTRLGADTGSDHELLIAKFRLKWKKVEKTSRPLGHSGMA